MTNKYSFKDFQKVWGKDPIIVIDTNIFLNLYKCSSDTTEDILKVMNSIPVDQFWIPAQTLEEFDKNKKNVKNGQYNKYKDVPAKVESTMTKARNEIAKSFAQYTKFKFPHVTTLEVKINKMISLICDEAKKYEEDIKEEIKQNKKMLSTDKIQLFIDTIKKHGNVGDPFNISTLLSLYAEGEQRYKYKIPPGYEDLQKDEKDETKRQKFGDLILWKQILKKASSITNPVILVTQELKEDWWILDKNKLPLKPRKELTLEFSEHSDERFVLMSRNNFIEYVSKINQIMIDNKTQIEMNADTIILDLISELDWRTILHGSGLSFYLNHSGDVETFVNNVLSNVVINSCHMPEIEINTIDLDNKEAIIEGSFETYIGTTIHELVSKEYEHSYEALLRLAGSITIEFVITIDKDNFIDPNTLKIIINGFDVLDIQRESRLIDEDIWEEMCEDCNKNSAEYITHSGKNICENCSLKYEGCPDCGKFFEFGKLAGSYCIDCDKNH
ncbi:DUF4935 domain-containing protein [Bacillus sp. 17RED48]|uniref:PIN-like domain-containing protein n=1 Tax=Bacillus sp. 17RED48 TaxID=2778093 RepID=UPI001C9B2222|nr:PIN domain-containing protein [Bacillus sp. 17RED48]MBY7110687.1 DUF4935 domain-containing protein [Bacillus sp. 17RED48]